MITRMTGVVNRVLDEEVRLQVGPLEYQVLIPEVVRRQLQTRLGEELSLHTTEVLEGNSVGSKFVPRVIGFLSESELDFFELFCTVEKIGARKALKALAQPVRTIAEAIQRQDVKWLTMLPGVGAATADQIVTTLKKKVTRFATAPAEHATAASPNGTARALLDDLYIALLSVGHNPVDATAKIDRLLASGKTFASVEEALPMVYQLK